TYNEGEGLWYRAGATDAENISYNNTSSQLEADNVQDVIDEIDTKAIYKSDDSDEAIKYISIKDTIGENLETIYFVPKLHITIKQGQLLLLKGVGNIGKEPEEGDIVEGFMTDVENEVW